MSVFLDIIIVLLIIVCVAVGYKNGFIKTVMSFLSFIIAFIMARTFSPQLSAIIYSSYIKPNFVARVTAKIESFLSNKITLDSIVKDTNRPPDFTNLFKGYGMDLNLPDVQKNISDLAKKGEEGIRDIVANLVENVAQGISYFIAFVAILAGLLILLTIVTVLINKAFKLPGLNQINQIGGIILGFFYGIVLSYIIVYLSYYIFPYIVANTSVNSISEIVDGTIFFKWFYNNPPIKHIMDLNLF